MCSAVTRDRRIHRTRATANEGDPAHDRGPLRGRPTASPSSPSMPPSGATPSRWRCRSELIDAARAAESRPERRGARRHRRRALLRRGGAQRARRHRPRPRRGRRLPQPRDRLPRLHDDRRGRRAHHRRRAGRRRRRRPQPRPRHRPAHRLAHRPAAPRLRPDRHPPGRWALHPAQPRRRPRGRRRAGALRRGGRRRARRRAGTGLGGIRRRATCWTAPSRWRRGWPRTPSSPAARWRASGARRCRVACRGTSPSSSSGHRRCGRCDAARARHRRPAGPTMALGTRASSTGAG